MCTSHPAFEARRRTIVCTRVNRPMSQHLWVTPCKQPQYSSTATPRHVSHITSTLLTLKLSSGHHGPMQQRRKASWQWQAHTVPARAFAEVYAVSPAAREALSCWYAAQSLLWCHGLITRHPPAVQIAAGNLALHGRSLCRAGRHWQPPNRTAAQPSTFFEPQWQPYACVGVKPAASRSAHTRQ